MRHISKLTVLTALLYCSATFAYRPVVEAPQAAVIEGIIDGVAVGTTPTIIVNSSKVYLTEQTVIKNDVGYLRPSELKMGMKVTVYGFVAKGGVMARLIIVGSR